LTIEAFEVGGSELGIWPVPEGATPEVVEAGTVHVLRAPAETLGVIPEVLGERTAVADERLPGLLGATAWQLFAKRAIDVLGSVVLLLLMLPVLLATALAIRLSSPGPALFTQDRIGKDGRTFRIIKFRSMHAGAHEAKTALAHLNEATSPAFKLRSDPRITRVGRVIRRLSIDEIPQLLNVLRGDMSLVGPRPPLPEEYETYGPRERQRLSVVPGLTCIWQVSGRSDVDFATWVDMDLEYIEQWTVRRDLQLLLKTIPAVLTGRGAY